MKKYNLLKLQKSILFCIKNSHYLLAQFYGKKNRACQNNNNDIRRKKTIGHQPLSPSTIAYQPKSKVLSIFIFSFFQKWVCCLERHTSINSFFKNLLCILFFYNCSFYMAHLKAIYKNWLALILHKQFLNIKQSVKPINHGSILTF